MKSGREHRVPLSDAALAIVDREEVDPAHRECRRNLDRPDDHVICVGDKP
jgi:hypothetical protein